MQLNRTYIILFIGIVMPLCVIAQKKTFTHEDGKKYYTIEFDTNTPNSWGTYRALNHHKIPYFEMTFASDQKINNLGDTVMIMVPTFYAYSYLSQIQGATDTSNIRKQNVKFFFTVKDKGRKLEFIPPDSLTRKEIIAAASFDKKLEVDITSFPPQLVLNKKPKWNKFPKELRANLAKRLKKLRKGATPEHSLY